MILLKNFYNNYLKYELLNKFVLNNVQTVPKILKIILSLNFKRFDVNSLFSGLIALELITSQKITFLNSKFSNVILKIRKGSLIGCKVTLRKNNMYYFYDRLINNDLYKSGYDLYYNKTKNFNNNYFSFIIKNVFKFSELENHYVYFKHLPELKVVLVFNSKISDEILFLLKLIKTPLKYK